MLNILYIGSENPNSTSYHRAKAITRLGHEVSILDVNNGLKGSLKRSFFGVFHYRTGYQFIQRKVSQVLFDSLNLTVKYDFVWIDSGELFGSKVITKLKDQVGCPIILYNIDDPTGNRDGGRFISLRKALKEYDLIAVVRKETAFECRSLGAKKVIQVLRSYDEIAHKPFTNHNEIPKKFLSEVAFIGTWMPHEHRDVFMMKLIDLGIPLTIWGDAWHKSPNYEKLKSSIRGTAIYGSDYIAAVQGAKICLGMLSKGNRDLHTTRSLEIPYMGGLFCGQRTLDHLELYKDKVEAVFWNDVSECALVCKQLLSDDDKRESIRNSGRARILKLNAGNENICREILSKAKCHA